MRNRVEEQDREIEFEEIQSLKRSKPLFKWQERAQKKKEILLEQNEKKNARATKKQIKEIAAICIVMSCMVAGLWFSKVLYFILYICLSMIIVLCLF